MYQSNFPLHKQDDQRQTGSVREYDERVDITRFCLFWQNITTKEATSEMALVQNDPKTSTDLLETWRRPMLCFLEVKCLMFALLERILPPM